MNPVMGNEALLTGPCVLKDDPVLNPPKFLNVCIKASAGSWIIQQSKVADSNQPPIMHRADGKISILVTPWISLHSKGHSSVFIDRQTQKTTNKENQADLTNIQIGNSALSRHRISAGLGRVPYRLDHNQRPGLEYAWGIDRFLAPKSRFATYTYDNQLDWTVQSTYGQLIDESLRQDQKMFISGRAMYDIAALEGTRISLGGYNDGLVRRAVDLGILNINGKGDETSLEFTRTFSFNPYKPSEFNQMIRLSYISHLQEKFRYKFQYDDIFSQIRIGGLAALYEPYEYTHIEFMLGYAKREDNKKLSHWFAGLNAGVHL
jgi:hypothetical protein